MQEINNLTCGLKSVDFHRDDDSGKVELTYHFQLTPENLDSFRRDVICGVVDVHDQSEVIITVKNVKPIDSINFG